MVFTDMCSRLATSRRPAPSVRCASTSRSRGVSAASSGCSPSGSACPGGPARLATWREASRILAGFGDGQATDGPQAGPASLVGLELAKEHGWRAPAPAGPGGSGGSQSGKESS